MRLTRNVILTVIAGVLIFGLGGFICNFATAADKAAPSGTAVVSVPEVMATSKRAEKLQKKIMEQRDAALAELDKLKAQLQAVKADMETRKPGSADYTKLKKEFMQKNAEMEVQKEFLQQDLMTQNQAAMEQLYSDILAAVEKVAMEKGYELVLDKDKIEFPSNNTNELTLIIQTHKVLYHADYLDITADVVDAVDKM